MQKKKKPKNEAKNAQSAHFIPTSWHTWHMCSRWHTSEPNVATIAIKEFVSLCQVSVARCDRLLHVGVYRKSLAFQVRRAVSEILEITMQNIGTDESLVQSQDFQFGDPFGPLKKCLTEKW